MVLKKWDGPSRDSSDDSGSALLRPRLADSGLYLIFGPATCDQTVRSALFPAPLRYLIDSICASLRSQNPTSGPLHILYRIAPAHYSVARVLDDRAHTSPRNPRSISHLRHCVL
jgi:hypothetical protein